MAPITTDVSDVTPEGASTPTISDIEQCVREMARALSAGRRPSREDADRLRIDVNRLTRSEKDLAPWRLAELHADVQEVVRHALPAAPRSVEVPVQRGARRGLERRPSTVGKAAEVIQVAQQAPRRAPSIDLEALFQAFRLKVDALHDSVEAGQRPPREEFELLHDGLTAFRRRSDGPEIRQMLDDVRLLHQVVLAEMRRSSANLWLTDPRERRRSRSASQGASRRLRFGAVRTSRAAPQRADHGAPDGGRLIEEARRLRERAEKFAAARSAGRVLPLRESDRLFLHFRIIRPQLDADTRALNDAALRRLVAAVVEVRARQER